MPDPEDLQKEIFGDSDEELSEEEAEKQISSRPRTSPPRRSPGALESASEEGDGDYKDEDGAPSKRLPSFKKKARSAEADDEPRAPNRPSRKKQRSREEDEELPADEEIVLPPEELARRRLHAQIDAAARSGRSARPKKRKKGDEDELDAVADQEVHDIKSEMERAANEDQDANRLGKPAVAKLKMLSQVVDVLQKQSLNQSIIDANLLETVRIWLEPLQDKSLPGLNIQRALFEALEKMFIDTSALKESGLGKIVLFYTKKNKRVSPSIKSAADRLIAAWSRPILKRSASYRDRSLVLAASSTSVLPGQKIKPIKLSTIMEQAKREENGKVRNAVRIPQKAMYDYTVVPRSTVNTGNTGPNNAIDAEKRRAADARLRRVQRKVESNKQRVARM